MTDILGQAALLLVFPTEADGNIEVDVDTVAYLDTGAAVTSEEDSDVDMEDVSIGEDTEEVADEDRSVVTGSELPGASAFQALPHPVGDIRFPPDAGEGRCCVLAQWLIHRCWRRRWFPVVHRSLMVSRCPLVVDDFPATTIRVDAHEEAWQSNVVFLSIIEQR